MIYGYALNHGDSSFTRVATIASGNPAIIDLSFDRDVGYLWAACDDTDDTCNGRTNVLEIDMRTGSPTLGKFYVRQGFERPTFRVQPQRRRLQRDDREHLPRRLQGRLLLGRQQYGQPRYPAGFRALWRVFELSRRAACFCIARKVSAG